MTISQVRGVVPEVDEEEAVARYLQQHADFFERNQAVLAKLRLPHLRAGSTISLMERQVEVLRERQAAAEARLVDFMSVARSNDALADKIHRLTRRLLRSTSFEATITELEASLREDFDAFQSVLVLIDVRVPGTSAATGRFLRLFPSQDANIRSFEALFASGKPRCGQVRDSQRAFLFGSEAGDVGSLALVPLGTRADAPSRAAAQPRADGAVPLGLLALGSHDQQRFHPAMSTEFLARMGELIADSLARPYVQRHGAG